MPDSIEGIASSIEALGPPSGESRDAHTLSEKRLHLARGPNEQIECFLEGDRESFGAAAIGRSLEWGEYRDLNTERTFPALVVRTSAHSQQIRLMAHLAYEAQRLLAARPDIGNAELLTQLNPFIALVLRREILSVNQQMGLIGELTLLIDLLRFASERQPRIEPGVVLDCWKGWDSASRDFAGSSVAIEVKATRRDTRRHRVSPMYQLLPTEGEEVFVFSVGLRPDRSREFRLVNAIDRALDQLEGVSRDAFLEAVGRYGGIGYDASLRPQYELEPGFLQTQAPALIRVDSLLDILRPESFVSGEPPGRVGGLRYDVSLESLPVLTPAQRNTVFLALLQGAGL